MKKVLWQAGLSNGETITEEKGNFQTIEGQLSPWQRLLIYIKEKDTKITSLSLITNDGRRWNIPSAGKHPKFHALTAAEKPVELKMFRKVAADVRYENGKPGEQGEWEDHFTCAEATYPSGMKLQVWVAEEEPHASWSVAINASEFTHNGESKE